ncbi:hypothetical protein Tcan_07578 [Toxocara canis]|uniref:Uncharacterized protein n=1 Tax=Toxocara canis TaxID=6265 RepID=A0A0B2VED3_TOXCA|nr:hypothetical protein Tcan_07578 [Toxocara canis]
MATLDLTNWSHIMSFYNIKDPFHQAHLEHRAASTDEISSAYFGCTAPDFFLYLKLLIPEGTVTSIPIHNQTKVYYEHIAARCMASG